jgi:5-methylcytosine-specific restriction endonuclease McrA
MATSRTGTSTWKKIRKRALHLAQAQGQTHCPYCRTLLDYVTSLTPSSAEVDHITAHARGGQDRLDSVQVICRRCNQSKGSKPAPKTVTVLTTKPLRTSRQW